ncbi:Cdk2 [Symbiodinium natans]|uniref:Cyclin-dependent kinase 2 homolog n=1 Tax=Symbiodinium natans TaxID=878477 RepID=A0A812GRL2_9DINO|nr:Cdk2 [Symbiodinium natans]
MLKNLETQRLDDERRFDRQYVIEEKEKPVGEGTYGAVHRAFCNRLQKTVAIKRVKMEHEEEGMPSTAIREVAVLKAADHPNVVKLLDVACSPGRLHLVFEFVEANLKQYMKKFGLRLEPAVVRSLQKQLMNGIDYCHARRIIHRDLKPQNILVDGEDNLKIADFGMARAFNLPLPKYTHEVVTTWYRSPEILFGCEEYSLGVDVWSAGCILGEMATGAALFHGDSEIDTIFQIFRKLGTPTEADWPGLSDLPDFKPSFPQWRRRPWTEIRNIAAQLGAAGVRLLDSMLRYDPVNRVSAKQTLQHESVKLIIASNRLYSRLSGWRWPMWTPQTAAVQTMTLPQTAQGALGPGGNSGLLVSFVGAAAAATFVRAARVARKAEKAEAPSTPPEKEAAVEESSEEPAEEAAVGFDITKQVGVTAPLGFWDPANLCKGEEEKFLRYRTAELKHGRVAMMAAAGAVFQHFVTFPGFGGVPRGIEAITSGLGGLGFLVLIGLAGYLETGAFEEQDGKEPGDFGDPLGLVEKNVGQYDTEWRNREINNGRFAMFAAIGIIAAENETGLDAVEQIIGV